MNKQRKVVITTTYNEMGIIIDTKVEEVAQPNLQPTCNQLATDTISRQVAIDELEKGFKDVTKGVDKLSPTYGLTKAVTGIYKCLIGKLPSAQPMRGRWIEYNYPGSECVYCDQCKTEYYPDDLFLGGNDYPNFCPNCGAKMEVTE